MEIKQKFGINIFRYMNYAGKYQESFLFIEHYPDLQHNDIQKLKEYSNGRKNSPINLFSYRIKNNKLIEISLYAKGSNAYPNVIYKRKFSFDKEGKIKSYTDSWKDSNTYEVYKINLEFDSNGKLINGNDYNNLNLEMFQ